MNKKQTKTIINLNMFFIIFGGVILSCQPISGLQGPKEILPASETNDDAGVISASATDSPTQIPTNPTEQTSVMINGAKIFFVAADACIVQAVSVSGGEPVTLTTNPPANDCWRPKFSPDGTKLAFVSMDGNYDLFTMNLDGTALTKVADSMAFAWSPDSTQLAYHTYSEDSQQGQISVVNADGSDAHSLGFKDTPICTGCDGDIDLSWSPDGNWIYISSLLEAAETYQFTGNLFSVDSAKHVQFSEMEVSPYIAAAWSADSQQVAFPVYNFGDEPCENYLLIGSVKGEPRFITAENSYRTGEPGMTPSCFSLFPVAWSPDQNYILAVASPMNNLTTEKVTYTRILRVPVNGETNSLLEYWPGYPGTFIWAPDGSQFAFTSAASIGDIHEEDGPLILMQNDPVYAKYTELVKRVKNSSGALLWVNP